MNPRKVTFANLLFPQLVKVRAYNIIKKHKLCHTLILTKTKILNFTNISLILPPISTSFGHKILLLFNQTLLLVVQCLDKLGSVQISYHSFLPPPLPEITQLSLSGHPPQLLSFIAPVALCFDTFLMHFIAFLVLFYINLQNLE